MADPRFLPSPLDFTPIERGLARGEARETRREDIARQEAQREALREERRQERIVQQGFQTIGVQQRQQGIDIQQQQLAAGIEQRQQEQAFREEQAALDREQQASAANISNTLAVADSLLKTPGIADSTKRQIFQSIASEMDGVFDGIDLETADTGAIIQDVSKVWKDLEAGKLNDRQAFIAMQGIAGQHPSSVAAQAAARTAGTLFTQQQQTARTTLAAGGQTKEISALATDIQNRLGQVNEDGQPVVTGARREALQAQLDRLTTARFEGIFGEGTAPQVAPAPIPVSALQQPQAANTYTFEEYKASFPNAESFDQTQLRQKYDSLIGAGKLVKPEAPEAPSIQEEALGFILDDTTPQGAKAKKVVEKAVSTVTPLIKQELEKNLRDPLRVFDPLGVQDAIKGFFINTLADVLEVEEE
jgi:hypothetical protein